MYPPKVEDQEVQTLIRDLAAGGQLPSGAAVRAALSQRYGSRGGVARIYRLLAQERMRVGGTALSPIGIGLVEQENRNLRELLKHQHQREDAHQAHWDREVGQLRDRVRALEALVQQAAANGDVTESVKREVEGAGTRAEQLEVQLRAFGPSTGRR
jgi:hypothetical protein